MGAKYFPHAYFSTRNVSLVMVLISTILWIIYGFDSTVESTFIGKSAYGYGLHWSTVQTLFLAIYVSVVNLQVGGFKSFKQAGEEIWKDLETIEIQMMILGDLIQGRFRSAKTTWIVLRGEYLEYTSVDPARGVFFSFAFGLVAALLFEMIWVPIYDWTNFGNWAWPVYYFGNPLLGNPLLGPIFARNVFMLAICLVFGSILLYLALDGEIPNLKQRFSIKWRFDLAWVFVLMIAGGMWGIWVFMPHSKTDPTQVFANPASIQSFHGVTAYQLNHTTWIFPNQSYFPQTEYTFYNASSYLKTYASNEIYGFYAPNLSIHLVNVLTKYATFAAVCYPVLVKVGKN